MAKTTAKKELDELAKLIYSNNTIIKPDYVAGFYRYWAKIDAIETALVKKKILKKADIEKEMIPILKAMKKDFVKK